MKNFIFIFVLLFTTSLLCFSQSDGEYLINFEDSTQLFRIYIDSVENENNIWQVGTPSKPFFDEAYLSSRAILTDSLNSYPVNDTSVFYVVHKFDVNFNYAYEAWFFGMYKVDSDSLNDFGKIEISEDGGVSWIDPLSENNRELFSITGNLVLTGKQDWTNFGIKLRNYEWSLNTGDTLLFRFLFISDDQFDDRAGLMFDNLGCMIRLEGIELNAKYVFQSTVYPNPATSQITILSEADEGIELCLQTYDFSGRLVETRAGQFGKEIELEIDRYLPGVYYYVLEDRQDFRRSTGKFIVR